MESQTTEIIADLNCREAVSFDEIDSKSLVKNLVDTGHEMILLRGHLLDQFDNGVWIYSNDDIESLIISYLHLEEIIASNNNWMHGEFLNDGLLHFVAKCDGKIVNIELKYCPEINIINLVEKQASLTPDEYLWWWRSIAHSIFTIANSIDENHKP
jgi:hypothetical protein